MIRISVVVPTYKRPETLERCLDALVGQDFDAREFEIIVADDGDERRIADLVRRWTVKTGGAPSIQYVPVRGTQGPAGARNRGWRNALGQVIAFTDDDTMPRPNWLSEGWKAMAQGAAAAAGRVHVPLPEGEPTDYQKDIKRMETCEFVTANCFVRRQAMQAIGGFDERFTSAWREDSDLQFMLLKAFGTVVAAPDAVVEHPVRDEGSWLHVLRAHRKILFDALLYKKHPVLYRERIRRSPPWHYYAIVVGALLVMFGPLSMVGIKWLGLAMWFFFTAGFCVKRLRGTSRSPRHVLGIILTSFAIPFVAVYWRLVGAWRFRVFFL